MLTRCVVAAYILLTSSSITQAQSQNSSAGKTDSVTAAQIRELERKIEAAVVEGDTGFLRTVFASDFRFTHGTGQVDSKDSWLQVAALRPFVSRNIKTAEVEMHGDLAVTVGSIVVTRKPRAVESGNQQYSLRYVRIFRLLNGRWYLLSHRTTEGG